MKTFALLICCVFSAATAHAACNTSIRVSTPDSQIEDKGDGTVTVRNSSGQVLMWKKCLEGIIGQNCESGTASFFTWEQALKRPQIVNAEADGFAKHNDWRLPTIGELRSLVEEQCYAPAINSNRFPNTPSWNVWSNSPFADYPGYAWHVDFYYGFAYITPKYGRLAVRLVRDSE